MALTSEGGVPTNPYPGIPYSGQVDPRASTGIAPYPGQPTANIPEHMQEIEKEHDGEQL